MNTGDNSGPDIDMGADISDDATVVMADNSSSSSIRVATGRGTRRRSQSGDGNSSSSSPVNKTKYPTNHKHIPFRSHSPMSTTKYQGNYWIRIRPVAHDLTVLHSHTMQVENPPARLEEWQVKVAPLDGDSFFRMDEDKLCRLSSVRRVTMSSSFDDDMSLHASPSPSISSFNTCLRRQPGSTNINPKNTRIFFGESGRPISIRPKNGYVR
ncbi:hypothetical protein ACHAW5_005962 [Stephanodiscus triporus]|uniref:Uncharacterized protein n=1 Tax=Stephanodiscus triporus TaxID=2934178 RepID=A0ABD3NQF1_9STRA